MIKSLTRRSLLATGSVFALALSLTACGGNVASTSAPTDASKFPAGPVTLTVGASPGGSTDLIGRALAENASAGLGALTLERQLRCGRFV